MGLIDLRKLNAEVDKLIAETNAATRQMVEARDAALDEQYAEMMAELSEYARIVADEIVPLKDISVPTSEYEFDNGYIWTVYIVFTAHNKKHFGVKLKKRDNGLESFEGWLDVRDSRMVNSRNHLHDYSLKLDDVVCAYHTARDVFEARFVEEATKAIKEKAEYANRKHEEARRKLEEV